MYVPGISLVATNIGYIEYIEYIEYIDYIERSPRGGREHRVSGDTAGGLVSKQTGHFVEDKLGGLLATVAISY